MAKQTDIIIAGAGAAGLTLAVLLARTGLRVCVIDPADEAALQETANTGRSVALMNSSLNILRAAGVWPDLQQHSGKLAAMRLIDDSMAGRDMTREEFDAIEIGEEQFSYNIPAALLRARLYEQARRQSAIDFMLGDRVEGFDAAGTRIETRTHQGVVINSPLLIGA
ncbi:MAG: FAD-dependent oxidoreductase, partial [Bdellovibrionales bacterium]